MLEARTVSNPYVRSLLAVIQAQGVPPQQLLAGLQLDEAALADPNGRLAPQLVQRIWQRALALCNDPLLGLKMAEAARPAAFRVLGQAAASSATLQQALALMLRYHRLVSESGQLSALPPSADGAVSIVYTEQLQRLRLLPQQVEAIVGGLLSMARQLSERPQLRPLAVQLRHAAQGERAAYRRFFGCEPQFGAAVNSISLSAADLARPLPLSDPELHRAHAELLERQLAGLAQTGSVAAYARQWLSSRPVGAARAGDLAQALGLSLRALQRQLQLEGSSWRELVDTARKQALQTLLADGLSLDEAAARLRYHDASSLSRAARRWFGSTPGQWRGRQGREPGR